MKRHGERSGSIAFLAIVLALVSASSMALEIIAARALAPYVGMSLYSWTIIIAVVLAGLSVGHWLGGIVADKSSDPAFWAGASLLGAGVATAISLPMHRSRPAHSGP